MCILNFWAISLPHFSFGTRFYVAQDGLELAIRYPRFTLGLWSSSLPLKCWDYRCMPPRQACVLLGTAPGASHVLGKCSASWAVSLVQELVVYEANISGKCVQWVRGEFCSTVLVSVVKWFTGALWSLSFACLTQSHSCLRLLQMVWEEVTGVFLPLLCSQWMVSAESFGWSLHPSVVYEPVLLCGHLFHCGNCLCKTTCFGGKLFCTDLV